MKNFLLNIAEKASNILHIKTPLINFVSDFSEEKFIVKNGDYYIINITSDLPKEQSISLILRAIRIIWSDTNGMRLDILDALCFSVGFFSYILQMRVFDYTSGSLFDFLVNDYISAINKQINLFGNTLGPQNSWINEVNSGHIRTSLETFTIWTNDERLNSK